MQRRIVFSFDLEDVGLREINPCFVGEEQCGSVQSYGPHIREYYVLHYVVSGKGTIEAANTKHEVTAGQIFVIFPDELVTYYSNKSDPWYYCYVGFKSSLDLSASLHSRVITAPESEQIFYSMVRGSDIGLGREWHICGKIFELMGLLNKKVLTSSAREKRLVRLARITIEASYQTDLKVGDIARYLGIDRSYFSRVFKKHAGESPQQYIVNLRLSKAAELMAHKGLSPGEAAHFVGYKDIHNFSKMFKLKYGVPPSRYGKSDLTSK